MQKGILVIHTDGGSRGNPGAAACAFVAEVGGVVLEKQSKFLSHSTNNKAEYEGVMLALEWLLKNKGRLSSDFSDKLVFVLDSELVVKQLTGVYKIKSPELQMLSLRVRKYINVLGKQITFRHVPRQQNKIADLLVNHELDRGV